MADVCPGDLCYTEIIGGGDLFLLLGVSSTAFSLRTLASLKGRYLVGSNTKVRILVADYDARIRSALHALLTQEPGQISVRESADVGGLATRVKEFKPDLVLLDWELPGRPAAALLDSRARRGTASPRGDASWIRIIR